ncbi:MAG TPA: sugar ABC transporter permease [Virgibacillus sp.]|nr:sugar ABC transporter permease [Virgibacillus sp.]
MATDVSKQESSTISLKKPLKSKQEKKRIYWAYLFILPQLIFFLVFTIYPIVMSYVYSAYEWSGIGPLTNFVGLDNFVRLFQDPRFWNAFGNTFIYMIGVTILLMPTSLVLAIILNNVLTKSSVFYRTIYFLPVVASTAVVGLVLRQVFGDDGAVNEILMGLGIIDKPHSWLGHSVSAMVIVILVGAWKFFGMMMVYWLAGLQTIPKDVIEAAKIDGANFWHLTRHVILPILAPIALVILLLCVTSSLHVFDLVKTLTDGEPYYSTDMIDLFVYRKAFDPQEGLPAMGYASAAGVIFGIITLAIALGLSWIAKRKQL